MIKRISTVLFLSTVAIGARADQIDPYKNDAFEGVFEVTFEKDARTNQAPTQVKGITKLLVFNSLQQENRIVAFSGDAISNIYFFRNVQFSSDTNKLSGKEDGRGFGVPGSVAMTWDASTRSLLNGELNSIVSAKKIKFRAKALRTWQDFKASPLAAAPDDGQAKKIEGLYSVILDGQDFGQIAIRYFADNKFYGGMEYALGRGMIFQAGYFDPGTKLLSLTAIELTPQFRYEKIFLKLKDANVPTDLSGFFLSTLSGRFADYQLKRIGDVDPWTTGDAPDPAAPELTYPIRYRGR